MGFSDHSRSECINEWYTSKVTTMAALCMDAVSFNKNISELLAVSVFTSTKKIFQGTGRFRGPEFPRVSFCLVSRSDFENLARALHA